MLRENLDTVERRISAAAARVGRNRGSITLVAVTKKFPAPVVREAYDLGLRHFGENYVQEWEEKSQLLLGLQGANFHFIGHLQSNKARKAAGAFAVIHSVDSLDLLERLDASAAETGATPQILIQADLAGEATKHGAAEQELADLARAALTARAVTLAGLMILPPWNENQEVTRPWFARLRDVRDRLVAEGIPAGALRHLSMGMSHDFEAAVEEGATMVRVGTAIFGRRTTVTSV